MTANAGGKMSHATPLEIAQTMVEQIEVIHRAKEELTEAELAESSASARKSKANKTLRNSQEVFAQLLSGLDLGPGFMEVAQRILR